MAGAVLIPSAVVTAGGALVGYVLHRLTRLVLTGQLSAATPFTGGGVPWAGHKTSDVMLQFVAHSLTLAAVLVKTVDEFGLGLADRIDGPALNGLLAATLLFVAGLHASRLTLKALAEWGT